jgi:hypothetical protein
LLEGCSPLGFDTITQNYNAGFHSQTVASASYPGRAPEADERLRQLAELIGRGFPTHLTKRADFFDLCHAFDGRSILLLHQLDLMLSYRGAIDAIRQLEPGVDTNIRITRGDVFFNE